MCVILMDAVVKMDRVTVVSLWKVKKYQYGRVEKGKDCVCGLGRGRTSYEVF